MTDLEKAEAEAPRKFVDPNREKKKQPARAPEPPPPETPEERSARRWLRRFTTRALSIDPPLQTVPLDPDGFAPATRLLEVARAQPGAPAKFTMKTIQAVVETSGGVFELKHSEEKGIMVRAKNRKALDRPEKKVGPKDYDGMTKVAKEQARKTLANRHAQNQKRWTEARKRQRIAAESRAADQAEREAARRARAVKDPRNTRRIADPRDTTKLAKITPPMRKLDQGTTTRDARQAVKDRKPK